MEALWPDSEKEEWHYPTSFTFPLHTPILVDRWGGIKVHPSENVQPADGAVISKSAKYCYFGDAPGKSWLLAIEILEE